MNGTPAHAVPASPTAEGLSRKTLGSGVGQSPPPVPKGVPQLGTRVIELMTTGFTLSGGVEAFRNSTLAGRPVWPTVTTDGNVGTTEKPTPAAAGPMATNGAAMHTMTAARAAAVRERGRPVRDDRDRGAGNPPSQRPTDIHLPICPTFRWSDCRLLNWPEC